MFTKRTLIFLLLFPVFVFGSNLYEGVFEGEKIVVTLKRSGAGYSGTIKQGAVTYPCTGMVKNGILTGKFTYQSQSFSFKAVVDQDDEDEMQFTSGGKVYMLERDDFDEGEEFENENPLGGGQQANNPLNTGEVQQNRRFGMGNFPKIGNTGANTGNLQTFTHNSGLSFQHPANWKVSNSDQGISILPDNPAMNQQGQPLEVLLMGSTSAQGVPSSNSPQVTQFFDSSMQQMFGNLQRNGQSIPVRNSLGNGVILTYLGTSRTGVNLQVTIYAVVNTDYCLYLMHASDKQYHNRRSSQAQKIFTSVKMGQPRQNTNTPPQQGQVVQGQRDPSLVGTWVRNETEHSRGYGDVYAGAETNIKVAFSADGNIAYGSGTVVFGGGDAVWAHSGRANPNMSYGKWTSSRNVVTVRWQDGTAGQYQYSVFQHRGSLALKLIINGEKKYFYKR